MQVSVSKEFTAIFVPDNSWARFSFCNAKEYYLVSENIFVVKMRGLCYLCTLQKIKDSISYQCMDHWSIHLLARIPLRRLVVAPVLGVGGEDLAVPGVPPHVAAHTELVADVTSPSSTLAGSFYNECSGLWSIYKVLPLFVIILVFGTTTIDN